MNDGITLLAFAGNLVTLALCGAIIGFALRPKDGSRLNILAEFVASIPSTGAKDRVSSQRSNATRPFWTAGWIR